MAHIEQEVMWPRNQYIQHQSTPGRNFITNYEIPQQQQHQFVPYTNHPVQETFQETNYQHQQPQQPFYSPTYYDGDEIYETTAMTSSYSNEAPESSFYEEVISSASSSRCSLPLGSNDGMAVHSQPSSPYVSNDVGVNHSFSSAAVVSPSPLIHYDYDNSVTMTSQSNSAAIIKEIAKALMRSAETFDPDPIKIPNIVELESMPYLDSISDSQTLTDLLDIIECDIRETYKQQHGSIISVNQQRPKKSKKRKALESDTIDLQRMGAGVKPAKREPIKSYHCIVCKVAFTSASHLKKHFDTKGHKNKIRILGKKEGLTCEMIDPANKPETWRVEESSCTICGKKLFGVAALQAHLKQHYIDMGEGGQQSYSNNHHQVPQDAKIQRVA